MTLHIWTYRRTCFPHIITILTLLYRISQSTHPQIISGKNGYANITSWENIFRKFKEGLEITAAISPVAIYIHCGFLFRVYEQKYKCDSSIVLNVGPSEDLLGGDDKETTKAKERETKNADSETSPQKPENDQVS